MPPGHQAAVFGELLRIIFRHIEPYGSSHRASPRRLAADLVGQHS